MNVSTTADSAAAGGNAVPSTDTLRWGLLLPFVLIWILPCIGLSVHWELNPQYHFGWFVPLFAIYTALGRWRTRPPPERPLRGSLVLGTAFAAALLPTWLVSRPNPDWPYLNWLLTGEVAALELCGLAAIGGRAWARHFAIPILLMFTAVPWPDVLESPFIQWMMRNVAAAAVVLLDIVGVGAIRHGNLIEVATGVVGVDEACSGIRSLQGSLMASLVLGELFRFGAGRRVILLGASVIAAFATNVVRASFLAWSASQSGMGAVERFHDPAGMTILLVCVGIILAIALFLDRDSPSPPTWKHLPPAHPLPALIPAALALWLLLTLGAVEAWYYDPTPPPLSPWRVRPPAESTVVEIPVKVKAVYHADDDGGASWKHTDGSRWLLYFFEWKFGPSSSRVSAMAHSPELCLPASGRELNEKRGVIDVPVGEKMLPFQSYSFRDGNRLLFVYYGLWQFRSERAARNGEFSPYRWQANLQSVAWREAKLGQQAAEVIIAGYADQARADAAFRELAPKIFVPREAAAP